MGARGGEEIRVALAERDEKIVELERQIADAAKADELLVAARSLSFRCQKSWHGSTQRVIIHAFIYFAGGVSMILSTIETLPSRCDYWALLEQKRNRREKTNLATVYSA